MLVSEVPPSAELRVQLLQLRVLGFRLLQDDSARPEAKWIATPFL